MKAKELQDILKAADPEADVITSFWNGYAETYTVVDTVWGANLDSIRGDFFGTPGAIDYEVPRSGAEKVVFIGSNFPIKNEQVFRARRALWRISSIIDRHRSQEWKKEMIYRKIKQYTELADEDN